MNPPTTMITKASSKYQLCPMNEVMLSSIRVTSGSLAFRLLKKTSKRGMTKTASTITTTTDMHATTDGIDQGRGDLAARLLVAVDVVGELVQDDVEVSGQLGRLEDADVEVGEGLGVRRRRGGERVASAQAVDHVLQNTFFNILFWVSSVMTSRASMIGMPALMKTASWRVKLVRSLRGTFFWVISNLQDALLRADLEWLEAPRDKGHVRGAPVEAAFSTPETVLPDSSSAL